MRKFPHYFRNVSHLKEIDVYRFIQLFNVDDPCLQHAIKKIVCAGERGAKDAEKDVREAIVSLERYLEMREEDKKQKITESPLDKIEATFPKTADQFRFGSVSIAVPHKPQASCIGCGGPHPLARCKEGDQ